MIDLLKRLGLPARPVIADIGTGSGALGITAKLEIPSTEVDLYDIDSNCLAVAKHNAALHELHLRARKRDLLSRPLRHYDIVLANLPYVPTHWMTSPSIKMEPRLAIDGGKDGLDHYRRLFAQLNRQHFSPRYVLTEALPPQHGDLTKIASAQGYQSSDNQDLIQVFEYTL
jgi:HemK-like putative methylase